MSNLKSVSLTVLELFAFNSHFKLVRLSGPLRTHRQTDKETDRQKHRHTSNEHIISAIHFVHLAEIIMFIRLCMLENISRAVEGGKVTDVSMKGTLRKNCNTMLRNYRLWRAKTGRGLQCTNLATCYIQCKLKISHRVVSHVFFFFHLRPPNTTSATLLTPRPASAKTNVVVSCCRNRIVVRLSKSFTNSCHSETKMVVATRSISVPLPSGWR